MKEDSALDGATPVSGAVGEGAAVAAPHHPLGRRNDRLLLAAVAAYALLLSILMISRGISLTPDVVVVGFGFAAVLLGRGKLFLRDWVPPSSSRTS